MRTLSRFLSAVKLRHVAAALLLGVFADPISAALRWACVVAFDLHRVPALWALLMSALVLAAEVALIYLALRGLSWLFGRGADRLSTGGPRASSSTLGDPGSAMSQAPTVRSSTDPAGRPEEGGGDERI